MQKSKTQIGFLGFIEKYYNNNGNLERYTNQKVLDIFFIVKK